jgi:pyruvate, water dikinase
MAQQIHNNYGFDPKVNTGSVFGIKYSHFEHLLKSNSQSLSLINSLEDLMLNPRSFDYTDIVLQCEQLIQIVHQIAFELNLISNGKYPQLNDVSDKLARGIRRELHGKQKMEKSSWTISLANLSHEKRALVGNKAANLAEVSNRVYLPTPKGFAITAFSCHHFFKKSGIYEKIKRKIKGLDVSDFAALQKVSSEIKSIIINSKVPEEVASAIRYEMRLLIKEFGSAIRMAVRSSATAEDSESSSFAGQFDTLLNVSEANLIKAYKEVVAGIFNPRAVFYRRSKGYRDIDTLMSVLCIIMIDTYSSGSMYTINPNYHVEDHICISANWGLGVSIVDGSTRTDYWQVCRDKKRILIEEIAKKETMLVMGDEYHLKKLPVPDEQQNIPCLSHEQIRTLSEYGLKLEDHFGQPLDIEWALDKNGTIFILQARPLPRVEDEVPVEELEKEVDVPEERILLKGGMTASPGAVCGPAHILGMDQNLAHVPEGSILVGHQTSPSYVAAMGKVKGIITNMGSVTGHMAAVAREFRIPTLVGTEVGTELIRPSEIITLDASRRIVFHGEVQSILSEKPPVNLVKDSPVYKLIRRTLDEKVVPLHLIDPRSDNFTPEGCRTLHDVIRFAHEMAMREMFDLSATIKETDKQVALKLKNSPLNIYLLDLGGGIERKAPSRDVTLEEIASVPFQALLRGIFHKNVRWSGPAGLTGELGVRVPDEHPVGEPSYAIVSKSYLNFHTKPGHHYATIDSFCSEQVHSNYIILFFKGGAADVGRRTRRAKLMALILTRLGFRVAHKGDMLKAEMRKYDSPRIQEKLDAIGRLLGAVRHLDMVLSDDRQLDWYVDEFFQGNYSFTVPQREANRAGR